MTLYLVIDYGQYEGMDVKEYSYASDAISELDERNKRRLCPVAKIIKGTELTPDQLRNLAKKEPK